MGNYIIYNGELYHHGVKGMKWGVRRTKEQLGYAVSNFKKKRQAKKEADIKKRTEAMKDSEPKKKSVSDMSDDELRKAIDRARMEDAYKQLRPEPVSRGKQFIGKMLDEAIIPAVVSSGKRALEQFINKATDDALKEAKTESKLDKLRRERDELDVAEQIKLLKSYGVTSWETANKKQNYLNNEAKRNKAEEQKKTKNKKKDDDPPKPPGGGGGGNPPKPPGGGGGGTGTKSKSDSSNSWTLNYPSANDVATKLKSSDYEVIPPSSKPYVPAGKSKVNAIIDDVSSYELAIVNNNTSVGRTYTSNVIALLEDKSKK